MSQAIVPYVVIDDFNDDIAVGWTSQQGVIEVQSGQAYGSQISLHTFDLANGNSISVDAFLSGNGEPFGSYVALVAGFNTLSDNLFVKIQDNNNNALFDTVYFYHGNNNYTVEGALVGPDRFDLSTEVASSNILLELDGQGAANLIVSATGQIFGGILENNYESSIVGLGFAGDGLADDFTVIPEPSSTLLIGLGALAALARRQRKQKSNSKVTN